MAKLRFQVSMSLDGFIAGPSPSRQDPLGEGGLALHEWVFKLAAWRRPHGQEGGLVNESTPVYERATASIGATVMGRGMFGGGPGPWADDPWNGWWGESPPFHTPVFVLTHHPRPPLRMQGGTTFHFVTDGVESAVRQAKEAAAGMDVALGGGASVAQQCFAAGLIDELLLNVPPLLLHRGTRLFDNLQRSAVELEPLEALATPEVTHLRYRVVK